MEFRSFAILGVIVATAGCAKLPTEDEFDASPNRKASVGGYEIYKITDEGNICYIVGKQGYSGGAISCVKDSGEQLLEPPK